MSILNGINSETVKRFEEILESNNVSCILNTKGIGSDAPDAVTFNFSIDVYGTDRDTRFATSFHAYGNTFQEVITMFLKWWDKEILRFNSFNQLTKPSKE